LRGGKRGHAVPQQRFDGRVMKRRQRAGPIGVYAAQQRQFTIRLDLGERECSDGRLSVTQLLVGQCGQISVGAAERLSGARIKGSHTAAREVVVDLGAHGGGRDRCGGGLVAERKDGGVGRSGSGPLQARGGGGKKCVALGLIHAGLAAAVGLGAEQGDDVIDGLLHRRIFCGLGRHDTVAVETGLGKDFGGVGDVRQADGIRRAFAEIAEDALGVGEHRLAFGRGGRDGSEHDRVRTGEQGVERGQARRKPGDGGEQLGHADAAVVV